MLFLLLLYFPLLLAAQQSYSSCPNTSFCGNCDANGNCTTCPTTRQLITHSSQQICGCSYGYGESNKQQCQACTNLYCYNCQSVKTSLCINCGNQSITHRYLNNSDCVCVQGYINVPWSFNCQTTQFDIRMLRFKNNMGQQAKIQALKTYVINSQDEGTLVTGLQVNTVVTTNGNSSCSLPETMDEASQIICPQGQLYQKTDQNMYGLAYLDSNQNPTTSWYVNFYQYGLSVSQKFIYQRNLTLVYNIIGFQLQNSGSNPLVLELLIVEVLSVAFSNNTNRRMLQNGSNQSKQSNTTTQPYMQYLFFIGYSRATILNETEIEDAIDRLMSLINGCMDFCAQCSIFRNSIQCTQCYGTRQFVNGSCQCNQTAALATQCQNSCIVGCQKCIQDCYNCQDITNQDYSDCPIPAPSPNAPSPNAPNPNAPSPSQTPTTNQSAQNIPKFSNGSQTSNNSNGSSQSTTNLQNLSSNSNNNSPVNVSNQSSASPVLNSNTTITLTSIATSSFSSVKSTTPKSSSSPQKSSTTQTSVSSNKNTILSNNSDKGSMTSTSIITGSSKADSNDSIIVAGTQLNTQTATGNSGNQNSRTPVYAVIGAGGAVLMLAPLIYLYIKKQAAQFLAERALDAQGIPWPHKKSSLPQEMDISNWEQSIPNGLIDQFFHQQQLLNALIQEPINMGLQI